MTGRVSEAIWTILEYENSLSYLNSNTDHSVVQSLISRYTDFSTAAVTGIDAVNSKYNTKVMNLNINNFNVEQNFV